MYMTASRLLIEEKPVLKLRIHDYQQEDIPLLDTLGINEIEEQPAPCRFIHIHNKQDFLAIRATLLEHYPVFEEKGPRVFLEKAEPTSLNVK